MPEISGLVRSRAGADEWQIGIVCTCVDAAVELARIVCEGAPLAVRYSKAAAADLRDLRRAIFKGADFREGPRAFAEKRPPNWQGC